MEKKYGGYLTKPIDGSTINIIDSFTAISGWKLLLFHINGFTSMVILPPGDCRAFRVVATYSKSIYYNIP